MPINLHHILFMPIFQKGLPEKDSQGESPDPGKDGEKLLCSCCLTSEMLLWEVATQRTSVQVTALPLLL